MSTYDAQPREDSLAEHATQVSMRLVALLRTARSYQIGNQVLTTFPHGAYDFISGSSFAAAHVSGVVALLLELHPGLPAADVRELLMNEKPEFQRAGQAGDGGPRRGFRAASDDPICTLMNRLGHAAGCDSDDRTLPPRVPAGGNQAS